MLGSIDEANTMGFIAQESSPGLHRFQDATFAFDAQAIGTAVNPAGLSHQFY